MVVVILEVMGAEVPIPLDHPGSVLAAGVDKSLIERRIQLAPVLLPVLAKLLDSPINPIEDDIQIVLMMMLMLRRRNPLLVLIMMIMMMITLMMVDHWPHLRRG